MKFFLASVSLLFYCFVFSQTSGKGIEVKFNVSAELITTSNTPDQKYAGGNSDIFFTQPNNVIFNGQPYPFDSTWIIQIQPGDTVEILAYHQDEYYYSLDNSSQAIEILEGDQGISVYSSYGGTNQDLRTKHLFTDTAKVKIGAGIFQSVYLEIVRYVPEETSTPEPKEEHVNFISITEDSEVLISSGSEELVNVDVYNSLGQFVMREIVDGTKIISMDTFNPGIYFFTASVNGEQLAGKCVVQ